MVNSSRSKIHPKIIFKIISKGHNVLIIGINNTDIKEVLKHQKARVTEIKASQTKKILEELGRFDRNQFDFIILNLELSKLYNTKTLVPLVSEKGKIAIFRVRNKNFITRNLSTKKHKILKYFKKNNIKIIQKFYCRKNNIYNNIFAHFFSYYVIYVTYKNKQDLAPQEAFTEKVLRKFAQFVKGQAPVFTSEKG